MEIKYLADRPDAIPLIAKWYFDEWGHKEPTNSIELTSKRLRSKLNRDKLPIPIIAIDDAGKVIGTAQLKMQEMNIFPERKFWLGSLIVDQQYRGKGIGQKLIEHAIELSKQFKINDLWLQTEVLDGGLYSRLGWTITDRINHNGDEIAVMHRKVIV